MDKPHYTRIRNRIVSPEGTVEKFSSISLAKKRSRQLQKAGHLMKVDRSEDPKPKPLDFGHTVGGKRRYYVSRAEERRISAWNERERRDLERKKREVALSEAQLRKVAS